MARMVHCVKLKREAEGLRLPALSRRARQAHLRKRLQGGLAGLAGAPEDADQREPPEPGRSQGAQVPGRADGQAISSAPAPIRPPVTCRPQTITLQDPTMPREVDTEPADSRWSAARSRRDPSTRDRKIKRRSRRRHAPLLLNRELGQLEFNRRVLAQAADPDVPLLERLRFLCIVSSNLDEFFEIRVAGLKAQIDDGADTPGPDGGTPFRGVPRGLASGPRAGRAAVRAVQ